MRCFWCESLTTTNKNEQSDSIKYANKEHVFPEAVGGKMCLPQGKVCAECNHKLGRDIDKYLKNGNMEMMNKIQLDDRVLGKKRNSQDKQRKAEEKNKMMHYNKYARLIQSKTANGHQMTTSYGIPPGHSYWYDENFSKALHKCAINVAAQHFNSDFIIENYQDLRNFILSDDSDFHSWSYAVAYSSWIGPPILPEPFGLCLQFKESAAEFAVLFFSSALYIIGLHPKALTKDSIKGAIDLLESNGHIVAFFNNFNLAVGDFYNHESVPKSQRQEFIGNNLQFAWIRAEKT